MEDLDFWRLCDELTVVQAAYLIAGCNPSDPLVEAGEKANPDEKKYHAAFAALKNALLSETIQATMRHDARKTYDEHPNIDEGQHPDEQNIFKIIYKYEPDWNKTTIKVEVLKAWLMGRGFKTGFFFPTVRQDTPAYLDPQNPCYAPKLAAAVEAWEAVSGDERQWKGKTPKQAIEKWLRENGSRFDLTDDQGKPNRTGIEQTSKVANWKPEGGATKTPVGHNPPTLKAIDKYKKSGT